MPDGKPLGRHRHSYEDNIKTNYEGKECKDENWFLLV
jgi:hypothetical protein